MVVVDEFDTVNKYIKLANLTSIEVQDIYNEAKDWEDSPEGIGHRIPMEAVGYAPLGGGAYTDKIFILVNGWKIQPYSGTYILTLLGTLITDDETDRFVAPDSGSVQIVVQVTSQGIIVATGSGVTQQDKEDIADLVETQTGSPIKTTLGAVETDVDLIKKIETGRWKVVGNQLIIYDEDKVTPLKVFNLSGEQTTPYSERNPV